MSGQIAVVAACALDPGQARLTFTVDPGRSLAEIVGVALADISPDLRQRARVALIAPSGIAIVPPGAWARVYPHAGVHVVIRLVPSGDDGLRTILSIAVSVAAVALAGPLGLKLNSFLGLAGGSGVGGALVTAGVQLVGALLINALVPPARPENERRNRYAITGWRNPVDPGGAVPLVLGAMRVAPPFAASSWTEIVGDDQFVRALFVIGEGRVAIDGLRIGETAIADFDEVEIEIREGLAGDTPVGLFPRQVVEEQVGVELTRPLPRGDTGEPTGGPATAAPVVRTTGADAAEASVILVFPAGLIRVDSKGRKKAHQVAILVEQRLVTDSVWSTVTTLTISARKAEGFYRQHSWALPSRGRWQVRLTNLTDETEDSAIQQRVTWSALQTIRPEYPLAFPRPLALLTMRIRATHQLSGALDSVNLIANGICRDWDHLTLAWVERPTSNPAALYRHILQGPANPKPVPDGEIDLALLQDWHDFCRIKGLSYNRILDSTATTLRETLTEVAAAGRATPRHDGARWGVVIDRPSALIVDHISPRNSWGFKLSRAYAERPHALVIDFADSTNDFRQAQRIVRRPGYTGDITLTERLELPGLTDPDTVWREGLRRFHEAELRPDVFEVIQDGRVRVATRGDTVALSHDVLSRTQWAGRVVSVIGHLVEIDELVTMEAGQDYALRFRSGLTEIDPIGSSTLRTVETVPGETSILALIGSGPLPEPGDLVHFGTVDSESLLVVVTSVEPTEDSATIIRAVAAAPEIDTLTDAATPPAWSSRVGAEIDDSVLAPGVARFAAVTSGLIATGDPDLIRYLLSPGTGATAPATYEVGHRPGTTGGWTTVTVPVAAGGGDIAAYASGDTVQLRVRGLSASGVAGAWSAVVTLVVGADDAGLPVALESVSVTTRLGGAQMTVVTAADPELRQLQIYRSASATLNRNTDAYGAPVTAEGARSYVLPVGDQTRVNLFTDATFDAGGAWSVPADVTIAAGVATKAAGAVARHLTQAPALTAGATLRTGFTVTAWTAGSVHMRALGTTFTVTPNVSAIGTYRGNITLPAAPTAIGPMFSAPASLSIDNPFLYVPTPACLPQGTQYLWIEPLNAEGIAGPVSGPFTISID